MRVLTPSYASPEQLTGGRLTTTTDVYSLGAVLYLLLTGRLGPRVRRRLPGDDRVGRHKPGGRRGPSKWVPELKGDLDAILLKTLRKDPQERYQTVEHFAEDLESFLASRTVRARSGNAWYRARKFVRRYWVPVTAAAVVVASLTAGLYIANRERAVAQRRFADVRQLANKLFDIDTQVRQLPGSAKARQLIVDTSLEYLRRLSADAQGDPELALEVATAYMSVAQVEGVTTGPNLGQLDAAERDLAIAERLIQSLLRTQPANRTALLRAAQIAANRMTAGVAARQQRGTLTFAETSADRLEKFQARASDRSEAAGDIERLREPGSQIHARRALRRAIRHCSRASELAQSFDRPLVRGDCLNIVALALRYQGDVDGALAADRESVRLLDPGTAPAGISATLNFVLALGPEGWILGEDESISLGRPAEAVSGPGPRFQDCRRYRPQGPRDEGSRSRLFLAGVPMADILRHSDAERALESTTTRSGTWKKCAASSCRCARCTYSRDPATRCALSAAQRRHDSGWIVRSQA